MSAGGSLNPSANPYPSGGPIDNQQRLQTSPNPSLPPADYSMGYARNLQTPSFFNPFSGYYGANTGMGGFQSQFSGFQPQFGGFGGFGGFQQPQFGRFGGGFQQPFDGGYGGGFQEPFIGVFPSERSQQFQYGGFQQPQYGGFQQPQYDGFQQPQFGGLGGFQQPFGGGFGRQSNRFTRRGQEYTQPYNPPQPNQPDYGNMNQFNQPQPNPNRGGGEMGGGMPDYAAQQRDRAQNQLPTPPTVYYVGVPEPYQTKPGDTPFGMGAFSPEAPPGYTPGPPVAQERATGQQMLNQGDSLLSSLASTNKPTNLSNVQRFDARHMGMFDRNPSGAFGPKFGGGSRGQRLDDGAYGYDGGGAYGGNFGGFNPMMGGGIGAFGGFQQQRDPNQPPPGMKLNPTYNLVNALTDDMPSPGSAGALRKQRFIPV